MTTIPFATIAVLERYENYLEQLEYEADAKSKEPKPGERSYIEPELKAHLEKVELDLREKVRQLHQDLPPSSYAVNLNHQTKEIEVIVENKQLIPKIEDMITAYPDDITIVIAYGKFSLDTPWEVDEDCDELCKQNALYGCDQDEVYVHGVCMTQEEKERAESVGDFKITESTPKWKIPEELEKIGCSDAMVIHLKKYSNAFDEKWNGKSVAIEDIGLPWGVHQYALDECMQNISELRNNEN